jgi:hypothetical protein
LGTGTAATGTSIFGSATATWGSPAGGVLESGVSAACAAGSFTSIGAAFASGFVSAGCVAGEIGVWTGWGAGTGTGEGEGSTFAQPRNATQIAGKRRARIRSIIRNSQVKAATRGNAVLRIRNQAVNATF